MRYGSVVAAALVAQGVSATWDTGASSYQNCSYTCTSGQSSGYDFGSSSFWNGRSSGQNVGSYGGCSFSGFKCVGGGHKKRGGGGGGGGGGCIAGNVHSSPSFSNEGKGSFAVSGCSLSSSEDSHLQLCHAMPGGGTCYQDVFCKGGQSQQVNNNQCAGATAVTIRPHPTASVGPGCSVSVSSIGFSCTPGCSTTPTTTPSSYSTRPSTTPSTSPSTTPKTSPSTTPKTSPSTSPMTSPSTSLQTSPSTSPVTSPSTSPVTTPSTSPSTPVTSPSTSAETSPVSPSTTPTTSKTIPTSYGNSTIPTTSPTTPVSPTSPSTTPVSPTSPVTSPSSSPVSPTSPMTSPSSSPVSPTSPVTSPTSPATYPTSPGTSPSSSTEVSPTSPSSSGTSSTSPSSSPTPATCSNMLLQRCLSTWITSTKCKDNSDSACYCSDTSFITNVKQCLSAYGSSCDDVTNGWTCLQGICAPEIASNSAFYCSPPMCNVPPTSSSPVQPGQSTAYTTAIVTTTVTTCPAGQTITHKGHTTVLKTSTVLTTSYTTNVVVSTPPVGAGMTSAPAPPATVTLYSTSEIVVTSCAKAVTNCPARTKTTLISTGMSTGAPAPAGSSVAAAAGNGAPAGPTQAPMTNIPISTVVTVPCTYSTGALQGGPIPGSSTVSTVSTTLQVPNVGFTAGANGSPVLNQVPTTPASAPAGETTDSPVGGSSDSSAPAGSAAAADTAAPAPAASSEAGAQAASSTQPASYTGKGSKTVGGSIAGAVFAAAAVVFMI